MYRRAGSAGVLKGVPSGPHAGGRKLIDAAKLPPATRKRLADVLRGRAEPALILHESGGSLASPFRVTWITTVSMAALVALVAVGFADPHAGWAYQPRELAAAYAVATMLLLFSVLSLKRRHARAAGNGLGPGRYLLPLDVVEVSNEDAEGAQTVLVTPLGSMHDARIRSQARRHELVLFREDGAETAFLLRSEREGEDALRRLEHTQQLLEDLTYGRDLEKAHGQDAFFDVRADDSWASLEPSGALSGALRQRKALLHGSLVTAATLLLGAALGVAAFVGRGWASDRGLFLRALRGSTAEALDEYLVRGTWQADNARSLQAQLAAQHDQLVRRAAEKKAATPAFEGAPRAEWELTPEELAVRRGGTDACLVGLRAHASTSHPDALPVLEAIVEHARRVGDVWLPVVVSISEHGPRPEGADAAKDAARVAQVTRAFEQIFSETCPATVLEIVQRPRLAAVLGEAPTSVLSIGVDITWPTQPTYTAVFAPTYVFDVVLRAASLARRATFRLTMPPPKEALTGLRPRSLFATGGVGFGADAGAGADGGAFAYGLVGARAFDRLYDEIYALFFEGDPRVPLHEERWLQP